MVIVNYEGRGGIYDNMINTRRFINEIRERYFISIFLKFTAKAVIYYQ